MKTVKSVFSVVVATLFLATSVAVAEQQLVFDTESGEKAPRSGLKSNFKPASKEVEAARNDTALPANLKFNRLHKPAPKPNLNPTQDGLHDPNLPAVSNEILPPVDGMQGITKDGFGNQVDWAQGLAKGEIAPVTKVSDDADDQDVNLAEIVITAVGYTPDVVFPHKAHSEWLACSNCHEAQTFDVPFFEPAAGENPITMNEIVKGKWCGWCHSGDVEKVAFPITDCLRCHSGPVKTTPTPVKPYMLKKVAAN